jgi:hypothetical protein
MSRLISQRRCTQAQALPFLDADFGCTNCGVKLINSRIERQAYIAKIASVSTKTIPKAPIDAHQTQSTPHPASPATSPVATSVIGAAGHPDFAAKGGRQPGNSPRHSIPSPLPSRQSTPKRDRTSVVARWSKGCIIQHQPKLSRRTQVAPRVVPKRCHQVSRRYQLGGSPCFSRAPARSNAPTDVPK